MTILGISAFFHDSAAALVVDGKIIAGAQEERFTRNKHDNGFPINACKFCLNEASLNVSDLDYVVFYEKPFIRFERIIETIIDNAPKTFSHFIKVMPIWLKERLNMRSTIKKQLKKLEGKFKGQILFVDHHMSHAAMSYYMSNFNDAAILVMDAVGEKVTTSLYHGKDNQIELVKHQNFPHSIGLLYSSFTYFLGFKVNSDEYKVMGLAPYGKNNNDEINKFIQIITNNLVEIHEDGSVKLNMKYFSFTKGWEMINVKQWEKLFGIKKREPKSSIERTHCNLAYAIQNVTENIILKTLRNAKSEIDSNNLCLAGGVALNCAANGIIREKNIFKDIFIPFDPGDGGGAIGAALTIYFNKQDKAERQNNSNPFIGPEFDNNYIEELLQSKNIKYKYVSEPNIYNQIAKELEQGKIIGWFQGRMEFGPRALGSRSILADPRDRNMKRRINESIKFREEFRPFAPVVLEDSTKSYFVDACSSPYMMFTTKVKEELCFKIKNDESLENEISAKTSVIPAVTHIDHTARIQTINEQQHPRYYNLLKAFQTLTGCPVLLNTSFNVMGEPIVCTPADALNTFYNSGIEILVLNNFVVYK